MNNHKGKIIGGTIGALMGGPIGAGIGAFFGTIFDEDEKVNNLPYATFMLCNDNNIGIQCPHCYNMMIINSVGHHWQCPSCNGESLYVIKNEDIPTYENKYLINFPYAMENLFVILGYLAKCDGKVSEDEIREVTHIIQNISKDPEDIKVLKDAFNIGKDASSIDVFAQTLSTILSYENEMIYQITLDLVRLCFIDGEFHPGEQKALENILLNHFKVGVDFYNQVIDAAKSEYLGQKSASSQNAYNIAITELGCSVDASVEEVKKVYRSLCQKYHPDKLSGADLPDEIIKLTEEKFNKIQEAYEIVIEYKSKKQAA